MTHDDSFSDYTRREDVRRKLVAELRVTTKAQLFDALQRVGIACVTVGFDGQGDSGQIEDISAVTADNKDVALPAGQLTIKIANADAAASDDYTLSIPELVESLCYELLEEKNDGWEIGDGAYGEFVFDVPSREISLTFNARFTDVETSTHNF